MLSNVYQKYINSKKNTHSEIKYYTLCLGNISKICAVNNIEKPGLKGSVIFFSVAFNHIDTNDFLDIHKRCLL